MRSIQACENGEWCLCLWDKGKPGQRRYLPFRCRSWRHKGECRKWRGSLDFERVKAAIHKHAEWTNIVLTFKQNEWPVKDALYRRGVHCWDALRKRMIRAFGKLQYIQTWERHAKGGPHVNVCVHNQKIYDTCHVPDWDPEGWEWLRYNASECGFGYICWAKAMYDADGLAGYMTKLANELTGAGIKNQTPIDAPRHFRRLRASRGLLPPPFKNPEITGVLMQSDAESSELAFRKDKEGKAAYRQLLDERSHEEDLKAAELPKVMKKLA